MKTWRWMLAAVAATGLVVACTEEPAPSNDDEGDGGGNTTTTTTGMTTTGTTTTGTTTSTGSCAQMPDFETCVDCYCNEDAAGCNAAIGHIIDNYYCGQSCGPTSAGMECNTFCMDTSQMPDMACDDCSLAINCQNAAPGSPAEADCQGYADECSADPACIQFVQKLQGCPQ